VRFAHFELFNFELRISKSKIQNRHGDNSKFKTEQFKIGFADNSKLKIQNSKFINPELNCGGYSMVKCTRFQCSSRNFNNYEA